MATVRLFVVRHGAVVPPWPDRRDALYGAMDVPLSDKGRQQADAAAHMLLGCIERPQQRRCSGRTPACCAQFAPPSGTVRGRGCRAGAGGGSDGERGSALR
eukprot:TRINITY_DN18407_c0_g1_i1.p2 TRINITY_DN18407_c0_g1~~TRINITY_DN18407_c0_g1_i1.p2  ORF type:complete len:101 (+),score=5.91 TRINITY_DN18407_c0_g1_i1:58-360(+)